MSRERGYVVKISNLDNNELSIVNNSIVSVNFSNNTNMLSPSVQIAIATNINQLNFFQLGKLGRENSIELYYRVNNIDYLQFKGLVSYPRLESNFNSSTILLSCVAETDGIRKQFIPTNFVPLEILNDTKPSVNQEIVRVLNAGGVSKTYDKIVLSKRLNSQNITELIDDSLEPGLDSTVIDYIYRLLQYTTTTIFTTFVIEGGRSKSVLYLYDSGEYIDNLYQNTIQEITNNNISEWSIALDYTSYYDQIEVNSTNDITDNESSISTTQVSQKLRRRLQILNTKNADLPKFTFRKTINLESTDVNNEDLARQYFRDLLQNAFIIECIAISPLININKTELGLWRLGAKIRINNNAILEYLAGLRQGNAINISRDFVIIGIDITYNVREELAKLILTPVEFARFID